MNYAILPGSFITLHLKNNNIFDWYNWVVSFRKENRYDNQTEVRKVEN